MSKRKTVTEYQEFAALCRELLPDAIDKMRARLESGELSDSNLIRMTQLLAQYGVGVPLPAKPSSGHDAPLPGFTLGELPPADA